MWKSYRVRRYDSTLRVSSSTGLLGTTDTRLAFLWVIGASCGVAKPGNQPPKNPVETHFCFKCDKDFSTTDSKRWCCVPCCGRAAKWYERECFWCQKKFRSRDETRSYCSGECRSEHRNSVGANRTLEMMTPQEERRWDRNLKKRIPLAVRKQTMTFKYGRGLVLPKGQKKP